MIIAIRAISSELPIRNRPILFIIFPPACAFDLKVLAAAKVTIARIDETANRPAA